MTVGQNAPTSPIAALRDELATLNDRIGELERARLRPIIGFDHDEGPANMNASLQVIATVTLTIPATWSSGWTYIAHGLFVARDIGATQNRQITVRISRDSTVIAGSLLHAWDTSRDPCPQIACERNRTDSGAIVFELSVEMSTNDDYEWRDASLFVQATRNS